MVGLGRRQCSVVQLRLLVEYKFYLLPASKTTTRKHRDWISCWDFCILLRLFELFPMDTLIYLSPALIVITTFVVMEGVAWVTHKYLMHGLMWYFHEDHHVDEPGFFEKNDAFFLIFAVPSAWCFITGSMAGGDFRIWIGTGIAAYGLAYFLVHDIFIHRRFKIFRRTENVYLMAIRKAHKVHHKHQNKEDGECFGMLWVPWKYFAAARKSMRARRQSSLG